MCFYEQKLFTCGDSRWGHFREHCSREYRRGETCGMKLVYQTYQLDEKCRLCIKIETKTRRREAELDRVARWSRESNRFKASIEKSRQIITELEKETLEVQQYRRERASRIGGGGTYEYDNANNKTQGLPPQQTEWVGVAHTCDVPQTPDLNLEIGATQEAVHYQNCTHLDNEPEDKSDTSSVTSSSDEIFSHRSGSSMTSHTVVEAQAAQDELFFIFSEDPELRLLYKDAFHVMSITKFEKQLSKILKSYCTDLSKEANNDMERNTVSFLRSQSRRHTITRRICEAFGPEDKRAEQFAQLAKQRNEKLPLLERFLNTDHPVERKDADEPDDSDDEVDSFAGYDCSNVELVRDFLFGKAFTNYQMTLRRFIDAHKSENDNIHISSSEGYQNMTVEGNSFMSKEEQSFIEKRPSTKPETSDRLISRKKVLIHWQCGCGMHFREDVVELWPGYADELVKDCTLDADDYDVEKQETTLESVGTQSSSSTGSTSATSVSERPSLQSDEAMTEVKSSDKRKETQDDWEQGKWVLLCLPGRRFYEVNNVCVKAARCNKEMYAQLYKCYHRKSRPWIRWLSLCKLDSVSFIRFTVYWRTNVNIEASDLGSLPPPTSQDYDFDRTAARPPILRTALTHFLQHPSHAPKGTRHLTRIPKKIGRMLTIAEEVDEECEGWGLHVHEMVCWKRTSVAFGLIGVAALAFAIAWCESHGGSIQDGFTVTGVLLAYGTILLGLVQLAVFQQSVRPN